MKLHPLLECRRIRAMRIARGLPVATINQMHALEAASFDIAPAGRWMAYHAIPVAIARGVVSTKGVT